MVVLLVRQCSNQRDYFKMKHINKLVTNWTQFYEAKAEGAEIMNRLRRRMGDRPVQGH